MSLFVSQRWFNPAHITVKERICCPDIELLAAGMHPYYVPREFSHIIIILVTLQPNIREVFTKLGDQTSSRFIF